jgi:hypothetical protein
MHGDRQPGRAFGHLGIVAQQHRLAVIRRMPPSDRYAQRHLAGQQLGQQIVIGIRRRHLSVVPAAAPQALRFAPIARHIAHTGRQNQHQRRHCRKMPQLLELGRPAPHTTLHSPTHSHVSAVPVIARRASSLAYAADYLRRDACQTMPLIALGLNHLTAPVSLREQVAFDAGRRR